MTRWAMACVVAAVAIQASGVGAATPAWKIPDPAKAEHPGAAEAPAGSPATYPDEAGFQQRAKVVIEGLATNELDKWRRGYFTGGDPGKYLPGAAMARLMLNPQDEQVGKYLNDDRSFKEHYHFAAVNWGRFLPLFGDVLTPETRTKLAAAAGGYSAYHSGGGTENHKTMWMTTANVLPHFLEGDGQLGRLGKEAVLEKVKQQLKDYVKGLYTAGQGEWDSSTYLMFTMNGLMNVYDFSPDPECRLLAKAALDWLATAYAMKYTDGVYAGPQQRGFASGPCKQIADQTGYLWWGSNYKPTPDETKNWLYTMHAITSSWRPNKVITNIARRNLKPLPVESRNSKPNYWFGLGKKPEPNEFQETLYLSRHYTMGSLWEAPWNAKTDQMTRFQLTASSRGGGIVFTGGHPTNGHYEDAKGRYDQRCQVGTTFILMSRIPPSDPAGYIFFSVPDGVECRKDKDWWLMEVGDTFLALHALGGEAEAATSPLSAKDRKQGKKAQRVLLIRGPRVGFILQTGDRDKYGSVTSFGSAISRLCALRPQHFASQMFIDFTGLDGLLIKMQYRDRADRAAVQVRGKNVTFDDWPIYSNPYVVQKDGRLTVYDGKDGFVVDYSGDLPEYKDWKR